jgi:hypothetical protein
VKPFCPFIGISMIKPSLYQSSALRNRGAGTRGQLLKIVKPIKNHPGVGQGDTYSYGGAYRIRTDDLFHAMEAR